MLSERLNFILVRWLVIGLMACAGCEPAQPRPRLGLLPHLRTADVLTPSEWRGLATVTVGGTRGSLPVSITLLPSASGSLLVSAAIGRFENQVGECFLESAQRGTRTSAGAEGVELTIVQAPDPYANPLAPSFHGSAFGLYYFDAGATMRVSFDGSTASGEIRGRGRDLMGGLAGAPVSLTYTATFSAAIYRAPGYIRASKNPGAIRDAFASRPIERIQLATGSRHASVGDTLDLRRSASADEARAVRIVFDDARWEFLDDGTFWLLPESPGVRDVYDAHGTYTRSKDGIEFKGMTQRGVTHGIPSEEFAVQGTIELKRLGNPVLKAVATGQWSTGAVVNGLSVGGGASSTWVFQQELTKMDKKRLLR